MPPKLNQKRALFVLTKIDEILAWEQRGRRQSETRASSSSAGTYVKCGRDSTGGWKT